MSISLLSLPVELRELIYSHLFASITTKHGFHTTSTTHTSLLRTNKQIHHESWRHLPLNIRLQFRGTETMLDTLLSVDQAVITRIRYISVKAFPFPLHLNGRAEYYPIYYFCNALTLFPGLCLERLVVEDSFHGFGLGDGWRDVVTYFDIESLIKCDAWKELVYITPNTDFIASGYDHRRKRLAQPENWDAMVKERDGQESGAEVHMWITPQTSSSEQDIVKPKLWSAKPGHEVIENWRIAGPDQDLKGQVQIIARRGKVATAVQTGFSERKTWKELKEREGGFQREDWQPYYNDMADAVGWMYGGWGRRVQLAHMALTN